MNITLPAFERFGTIWRNEYPGLYQKIVNLIDRAPDGTEPSHRDRRAGALMLRDFCCGKLTGKRTPETTGIVRFESILSAHEPSQPLVIDGNRYVQFRHAGQLGSCLTLFIRHDSERIVEFRRQTLERRHAETMARTQWWTGRAQYTTTTNGPVSACLPSDFQKTNPDRVNAPESAGDKCDRAIAAGTKAFNDVCDGKDTEAEIKLLKSELERVNSVAKYHIERADRGDKLNNELNDRLDKVNPIAKEHLDKAEKTIAEANFRICSLSHALDGSRSELSKLKDLEAKLDQARSKTADFQRKNETLETRFNQLSCAYNDAVGMLSKGAAERDEDIRAIASLQSHAGKLSSHLRLSEKQLNVAVTSLKSVSSLASRQTWNETPVAALSDINGEVLDTLDAIKKIQTVG